MIGCPHGDPTCPCQDGDSCHYEGFDPMPCPNLPYPPKPFTVELTGGETYEGLATGHCHVEGCRWDHEACGLGRLGVPPDDPPPLPGDIRWACGAQRAADIVLADMESGGLTVTTPAYPKDS